MIGLALTGIGIVVALDLGAFLPLSIMPACILLIIGMSIIIGSIVQWYTPSVEEKKRPISPARNVRYCMHCGAHISLNAKFCPTCGKKQERIAETSEETQIY